MREELFTCRQASGVKNMVFRIALLLCGITLLGGCSSIRTVHVSEDASSFKEVNRAVRGKVAVMTLNDGSKMHVVGLNVEPEWATWVDRKENKIASVPTSDVREIKVVKAGPGALRGLVIGAVIGAAAGGLRAAAEGDDPAHDPIGLSREEKLEQFPPAHALYAALATTPLGAIIGSRRTFRFEASASVTEDTVSRR